MSQVFNAAEPALCCACVGPDLAHTHRWCTEQSTGKVEWIPDAQFRVCSSSVSLWGMKRRAANVVTTPVFDPGLYGAFFVKPLRRGSSFFLRQFLCPIWSPFLRPDPHIPDAVARRGCQGWASRQRCHALPSSPGHTLTAPSTTAHSVWSG